MPLTLNRLSNANDGSTVRTVQQPSEYSHTVLCNSKANAVAYCAQELPHGATSVLEVYTQSLQTLLVYARVSFVCRFGDSVPTE